MTLGFYKDKSNLILLGSTGEGKTHLAIALGKRLCDAGISTVFLSVNMFFEEINAHKASGKYLDFIRKIIKTQVIIFECAQWAQQLTSNQAGLSPERRE